jgi:uncharacterized Zn-finger protein
MQAVKLTEESLIYKDDLKTTGITKEIITISDNDQILPLGESESTQAVKKMDVDNLQIKLEAEIILNDHKESETIESKSSDAKILDIVTITTESPKITVKREEILSRVQTELNADNSVQQIVIDVAKHPIECPVETYPVSKSLINVDQKELNSNTSAQQIVIDVAKHPIECPVETFAVSKSLNLKINSDTKFLSI